MEETDHVEFPARKIFRLPIGNVSKFAKQYSRIFIHGDYADFIWRVLMNHNEVDNDLSLYLEVANARHLPPGWSINSMFSMSVVNPVYPHLTVYKETCHRFYEQQSDWGFASFMPLDELYDPGRRFLQNDTLTIQIDFVLHYDSRAETGYVGLKNHEATSCMASLLQTLYNIPYFRKAVNYIAVMERDMLSRSIPLTMQHLFYELQYNHISVANKELTELFGCHAYDAHELNMLLYENLEEKMKGTVLEGTIQRLFRGHQINCITCVNVNYSSVRPESFYDLQLDVKGCPDVYASFDKYVTVEHLESDNKYQTEEHGLQDARKGALFLNFPPVLQLQLKRFEYDSVGAKMVKINDRYKFPLELDLDRENGKYLSPYADRRVRNLFTLHSVLAHRREEHGGHYHVFIRPTLSDQWLNFDDEQVTITDTERAVVEQYGGEEELIKRDLGFGCSELTITNTSNAYMLVYIRKSDIDSVIYNVNEEGITEQLRVRLEKEQEENARKINMAKPYTTIKVARNADLVEQIGKDVCFDLVDHDKVRSFHIDKQMPFYIFKEELAKEFGIPVHSQRFWLWTKRANRTYRPHRPLTQEEETQPVGMLREIGKPSQDTELNLFLDVDPVLQTITMCAGHILIFFKLYDPVEEQLRYVGNLLVESNGIPLAYLTKLNEMAGFSSTQLIELYEEITFAPSVMCEPINVMLTFQNSELVSGDIICFQKAPVRGEKYRYPTVPSYFKYVRNLQVVRFRSLEEPKKAQFSLELSKLNNYDDIVRKVASKLNIYDPSRIRLTPHDGPSNKPKPTPIRSGNLRLIDILMDGKRATDILYYKVEEVSASLQAYLLARVRYVLMLQ